MSRHIAEFEHQEGIKLDKSRIKFNAGLRSVAKLCLNSLWGKFGQRENISRTEVLAGEPEKLFQMFTNPNFEVNSVLPVDDNTAYVSYHYKDEAVESSPLCNVVVAAYTTALARLKLFSYLEPLGERVLYYDTLYYIRMQRR